MTTDKIYLTMVGLCCMLLAACSSPNAGTSPRVKEDFDAGWRFVLNEDRPESSSLDYDDGHWRVLNLPHDWAIEGDFSQDNPSGIGGGALPGGIGWYRKSFIPAKSDAGKKFRIEFDGVYMNSEVYINGQLLGKRPYGYISFGYDLTPYLKFGEKNVVAVRVDNAEQPNSRWYSGCGIYRNVWLVKTNPIHVATWGTFVSTQAVDANKATLKLETTVANESNESTEVMLLSHLLDATGKEVANSTNSINLGIGEEINISDVLEVRSPVLWNINRPYLYTLVSEIQKGGECVDTYTTPVGIRTFQFDARQGFSLNGEHLQIRGVCLHHDQGCLGAAIHTRAIERQLEILKEMGCNAIRCSHNPPSPELLDLCDQMGFIVMDEAFDMWRKKKTAHDYARYFPEWHERDLHDFVLRDRNHPSIFMWSIGNEVLEQWGDAKADTLSLEEANLILNFGHDADQLSKEGEMSVNSLLTKKLADFVRGLDPTRPITAGCNEPNPANHLFRSGALDIIGYNYHNPDIPAVPNNFPGKPFIITESNSALMTRGYYRMPSDHMFIWPDRWDKPFSDSTFSCSSYDNCHVPWGNTHEETLKLMRKYPFISGQFIWTGFDYIGEPTPFGWPARSSYFGIVDLAGFPKDVYYLYQSEWTDQPVLHLFPHWNWTPGETIDMWCYYNQADEVELFINGKSQGAKRKDDEKLHASWRVAFESGTVKVIARKDGKAVREQEIRTAGEPAQIRLTADRDTLESDGKDISFVTVEIVDKDGNLCPNADNLVHFDVDGMAFIAGVDNGSPISLELFKDNKRKAFYGKCLVVVQNEGKPGTVKLRATSANLKDAEINIAIK